MCRKDLAKNSPQQHQSLCEKGRIYDHSGSFGMRKTTLLRLLAGFETASEGIITIAGNDITNLPPYKRNVNTVFQNTPCSLISTFTTISPSV